MIDVIKLSESAKNQLITIRKRTSVEYWNIICRWGFLAAIKDSDKVTYENIITDSNVEMTWRTFAGQYEKLYMALLIKELKKQGIEINKKNVNDYFRIYLHNGISILMNPKLKNISDYSKYFLIKNL